jgi:hypothetical protein
VTCDDDDDDGGGCDDDDDNEGTVHFGALSWVVVADIRIAGQDLVQD